jgi:hypothetical protein
MILPVLCLCVARTPGFFDTSHVDLPHHHSAQFFCTYSLPLLFIVMCYMSTYMLLFTLCWPSTRYSRVRTCWTFLHMSLLQSLYLFGIAILCNNLNEPGCVRQTRAPQGHLFSARWLFGPCIFHLYACLEHARMRLSQTSECVTSKQTDAHSQYIHYQILTYMSTYTFMLHAFLHCASTDHRFC